MIHKSKFFYMLSVVFLLVFLLVGAFGIRLKTRGGDSLYSEVASLGLALAAVAQLVEHGSINSTQHYAQAFNNVVNTASV